ncbi:mannose-6-phosphate isomerase, class I [Vibrio palustris]|uniref:Mannose-6-phosphate isomerase n=1 Tax=Vibrio palustris TaxID=1918946 RepID=A0A1R4B3B9_9VIBR|nr:mannose-6-phosphate isomerase, class I [Vibrio palustris]SJL83412.1 Mannose-6-phosphate isomerase [Vibrio palustris]
MLLNKKTAFFRMQNVIKNYSWGSKTSIYELFGIPNSENKPQAEIWMGTHPNGCSTVECQATKLKLSDLIAKDKTSFLSAKTVEEFGELPYLFKVLAANQALSVQVHPSKQEAEVGYEKENNAGIPINSPVRNYKDSNHKPELVYALTRYQAMNGFRNFTEILNLFKSIKSETLLPLIQRFSIDQTASGLEKFFVTLLSLSGQQKKLALNDLLSFAQRKTTDISELILELSQTYPGDIGLFTPLLLNIITLNPGEAMYLEARTPHAYIKGTGLEVMANSDNVLRAGLTTKHIDVIELASCTDFKEKTFETLKLEPTVHEFGEQKYAPPISDFKFSLYPSPSQAVVKPQSAEIIMAIDTDVTLTHRNENFVLSKGQSVFIPAYVDEYSIQSQARIARVYN